MFRSMRSRLLALLTAFLVGASLVCIAVLKLAERQGDLSIQPGASVPIVLSLFAGFSIVWCICVVLGWRLTAPLGRLVAASREIAMGRYPDAALAGVILSNESGQLADVLRQMSERVTQVDSRDRRFLMSISHELRTPITAIAGHAQALQDGLADDPEIRDRSLNVIQAEAERLQRLVDDIIDLARLRSNKFTTVSETVDIDDLGAHFLSIYKDQVRGNVVLTGSFEHVSIVSDGQRILQILRNLTTNAIRYAETKIVVEGKRDGGSVKLSVFNDGEPIAPELADTLFEPFVGAKREGGMGLGLAIARELAWALGGNLSVESHPDGTLFQLALPLEPPGSGR